MYRTALQRSIEDDHIAFDFEEHRDPQQSSLTAGDRRAFFEQLIKKEFPERGFPNLRDAIKTCTHELAARKDGASYLVGDWVEIRGAGMKWKLEMVTRVIKQAPDDWDWNDPENEGKTPNWKFVYNAGRERMLKADDMRSSQEALCRIFGNRPWVWQQWACLKLEHQIRFHRGHHDDFDSKDVRKYAAELWNFWLNSPSNSDFKARFEDDRIGDIGRRELIHHIMTPFELIDDIKEEKEGSIWTFSDDKKISVYTYLAVLGSGYLVPFVLFGLQITIPLLLAQGVFTSSMIEEQSNVTRGMVCVVMILYILKVVPDTLLSFTHTIGIADSLYSRLMSLTASLWTRGNASFGQMIGYKLGEVFCPIIVLAIFRIT